MPAESLAVILDGQHVGHVERRARDALVLRYDDEYRNDAEATTLSVSMPAGEKEHGDGRITPWLWGLLPDNSDVVRRWGREFGVSVATPFHLLGTNVGRDCPGAVQFCRPDEVDQLLDRRGEVEWLTEGDVAGRIRTLRSDSTSWLGPGFAGQFSLGGAQAKTALHLDATDATSPGSTRWGVATGSVPTTHILKPAMTGFESQHLNEHLCLAAARALGLPAAHTWIETFLDESAIVVERFDRIWRDGRVVRVHQEDLCQALSVPPARKYQSDGGPTPAGIVELIRRTVTGRDAEFDVWRFIDALAFNWLIAGSDAHAKNYGLLLAGPQVRLAPLYDIASMLPYDDSRGRRVKLAMKVGKDYKLPRTDRRSAWHHAADELRVDRDRLILRVADLAARVPEAFDAAVSDERVAGMASNLPERLAELVSDRCAHCLEALQ